MNQPPADHFSASAEDGDRLCHVINPAVIDCPLGDGLALFDSRSGDYFSLNGTAALLWQTARTPASRAMFLGTLRAARGAPTSDAEIARDLDAALKHFIELDLFRIVTPSDSLPAE